MKKKKNFLLAIKLKLKLIIWKNIKGKNLIIKTQNRQLKNLKSFLIYY